MSETTHALDHRSGSHTMRGYQRHFLTAQALVKTKAEFGMAGHDSTQMEPSL
ncbi:MAG: hypothetical protein WD688_25080 [Candidatus Binatia bacterium]